MSAELDLNMINSNKMAVINFAIVSKFMRAETNTIKLALNTLTLKDLRILIHSNQKFIYSTKRFIYSRSQRGEDIVSFDPEFIDDWFKLIHLMSCRLLLFLSPSRRIHSILKWNKWAYIHIIAVLLAINRFGRGFKFALWHYYRAKIQRVEHGDKMAPLFCSLIAPSNQLVI